MERKLKIKLIIFTNFLFSQVQWDGVVQIDLLVYGKELRCPIKIQNPFSIFITLMIYNEI